MKIAFVYDRVNKFGGAEQVLLALHEVWPEAPMYTAVYNPKSASWANVFSVYPSFLNNIPFAKIHHEWFAWATPFAFESFMFDKFDVVLSVTSAEAKAVITKPDTLHICYCLTPTRYLWSGYEAYANHPGVGMQNSITRFVFKKIAPVLQRWDLIASTRPDAYVAISDQVRKRIKKYYHQEDVPVIYPPVNIEDFLPKQLVKTGADSYFLTVSRLVSYKRLDLLIDAFNTMKKKLIIIGDGLQREYLEKKAGSTIQIISKKLTVGELARYYQGCQAFVFAGQEDFGISACEAQAAGKPVLCYADSGMAETLLPGITGEVFSDQSVRAIVSCVTAFDWRTYKSDTCIKQAKKFSKHTFTARIKDFVEKEYRSYQKNYSL